MALSTMFRAKMPPSFLGMVCSKSKSPSCFCIPYHLRHMHSNNTDPESGMPFQHPTKGTLMYAGKLTQSIKGLKVFSLSTSILAIISQPLILSSATDDFKFKAGLLGTFSMMVMSTPILVQYVTKKYVTDIYFNSETKKFTLATRSLFLQRRELEYEAEDVQVPLLGGMFTSHIIKGKPYFIELSEFRNKQVYIHMVGYDKPMDDPSAGKKKKKFGLWEDEEETILQKEMKKMQEKRREMDASALKEDKTEKETDKTTEDSSGKAKKVASGI